MTHTLIFATNNQNKVLEISGLVPENIKIITLKDAGIFTDIEEPYPTIEENAREKSRYIFELTKQHCFGEDTGLLIDALNGEPGVKSARYAGEDRNFEANLQKVIRLMQNASTFTARFKTIISLVWQEKVYSFEGICEGSIALTPRGTEGFGYDPIFIPTGSEKTFAEMDVNEKNIFSHRKKAFAAMLSFLQMHQY